MLDFNYAVRRNLKFIDIAYLSRMPSMRVITESTDAQFLFWLTFQARRLGLYVVQRLGSVEVSQVLINAVPMSLMPEPPEAPALAPLHTAFYFRLDVPVVHPPKAADEMRRKASRLAMSLPLSLGYHGFQRVRVSSLTDEAQVLDVKKPKLARRRLYEIVAEMMPEEDNEGDISHISVENDRRRAAVLKSRKHQ